MNKLIEALTNENTYTVSVHTAHGIVQVNSFGVSDTSRLLTTGIAVWLDTKVGPKNITPIEDIEKFTVVIVDDSAPGLVFNGIMHRTRLNLASETYVLD